MNVTLEDLAEAISDMVFEKVKEKLHGIGVVLKEEPTAEEVILKSSPAFNVGKDKYIGGWCRLDLHKPLGQEGYAIDYCVMDTDGPSIMWEGYTPDEIPEQASHWRYRKDENPIIFRGNFTVAKGDVAEFLKGQRGVFTQETQCLSREAVKKLGFTELPHMTIGGSLHYDLGLHTFLSLSNLGNPNEMVCICQRDPLNEKVVTDVVRIHNYDYHGYLTLERLKSFTETLRQDNT